MGRAEGRLWWARRGDLRGFGKWWRKGCVGGGVVGWRLGDWVGFGGGCASGLESGGFGGGFVWVRWRGWCGRLSGDGKMNFFIIRLTKNKTRMTSPKTFRKSF